MTEQEQATQRVADEEWTVDPESGHVAWEIMCSGGRIAIAFVFHRWAWSRYEHAEQDQAALARSLARARLMAAAPKLLAVCRTVAGWPHREGECEIVDRARAAVAAATGEEVPSCPA